MSETLQALVVTLVAASALLVLVRSYRPAPEVPSKPVGCSNCAPRPTPHAPRLLNRRGQALDETPSEAEVPDSARRGA